MKKLTLAIAISILGLTACNSFANTSSKQNNAKSQTQTQSQIKPKAKRRLIDVRSPEEYKAGHLSNSVNIPVGDIASKISAIEPNKTILSIYIAEVADVPKLLAQIAKIGLYQCYQSRRL